MRLLTKTTLYFLLTMVPLLAAGGFYLFHSFSKELAHEMDEELIYDELQWLRYLQNETLDGPFVLKTPELLIYPVNAPVERYPTIIDTEYFQEIANAKVPYRQLSHVVPVNGTPYQVTIRRSQVQKSVLVTNVTRIMLFVFLGLFLATLLFNWLISTRLWQPFRSTLAKIRNANLHKLEQVQFEAGTTVAEFDALNHSLNSMTEKIHADYISMKEFTEDAAHEMQTPLAIAQSKLELVLQEPNLNDEQVEYILQAGDAIKRLGRLNQSLLLLAKIENHQYDTTTTVNLVDITKKYLQLFEDVIRDKRVTVETYFNAGLHLPLHPALAESLVSNLVGNAVKYNYPGGRIIISVDTNSYSISNTSELPPIEQGQLFRRFKKHGANPDGSNGLGLAIVKKIVDTAGAVIRYSAASSLHTFKIEISVNN